MKTFLQIFSLFLLGAIVSYGEERLNPHVEIWQQSNAPVLLVKKLDAPLNAPEFLREGVADEPTRLLVGVVEISTTDKVAPGTVVLLELLTLGQPGAGPGESPYWMAEISKGNPATKLNDDGTVIYVLGEFTHVWNGNVLKKAPHLLHGVWKRMLDKVLEEQEAQKAGER